MVEVIFGEAIFKEEVICEVDIIIEWIESWENRRTWRQSRSHEREKKE